MLSKWQVWDFYENVLSNLNGGLKIITVFDSWLEYNISRKINTKGTYQIVPAFDITVEWIEDRLLGLSLFGNQEQFIITQCESFSSEVKDFFKERQDEIADKELILIFNKDDLVIKSLEKNESVIVYKIESPKFWETNKLLDFMLEVFEVRLTQHAKYLLMDSTSHDCTSFSYYLNLLKVNFDNQKISDQDLKSYINTSRLDQFTLVSLFNIKKSSEFTEKLIKAKLRSKEAIIFFGFMLSHIIKLMDPSYLDKKSYKSKYDKEILAASGNWSEEELKACFDYFEKCQIMAKNDFFNLESFLKFDSEKSFYYTGV